MSKSQLLLLLKFFEFSHQRKLIFYHGSLSDKSSQISRILLSILAKLLNAVAWMVFKCPLTYKSSLPLNNPPMTVPISPIKISIINTFIFHSFFFQFPSKIRVLILLFTFFQFFSVVNRTAEFTIRHFLFFIDYYYVSFSGRDSVIRFYLKILEKFVDLILQDRFWAVYISSVCIVKLKFLAHPAVYCHILSVLICCIRLLCD